MSETQCQQLGLNKLKIYGAELPNDHMLLRSFNKDNNNDIFHPPSGPSSSSWLTTTQAMSKNLDSKSVSRIIIQICIIFTHILLFKIEEGRI